MGASGSKQGRLTAGCWPLRLRRGSSSPATKATASTQTDVESSLTGSGLVKGGAAADAAAVVSGAPLHAAAPSLGLPRPAVPPTPARDVRFSLDSMAGSEYGLESARPPAARLVLSAAADDVSPQRQLPMVEEPSGPQAGGEWEEAERLTELYRVPVAAVNLITDSSLVGARTHMRLFRNLFRKLLFCNGGSAPFWLTATSGSDTFSMQVFASVAGDLAGQWGTGTERAGSFCEALLLPQVHTLVCVPDTTLDYRFSRLACVAGNPRVRFYAGTPLVSSRGHRLGSLCIFDLRPRRLSADALNLLACLAEMAARLLEEHQVAELEREQRQRRVAEIAALQREPAALRLPILLCDAADSRWPVLWSNSTAAALAGLPQPVLRHKPFFELFASEAGPSAPPAVQEATRRQLPCAAWVLPPGGTRWAWAQFSPASQQLLDGERSHPRIDVSAATRAGGSPGPDASLGLFFVALQA